MNRRLAAALSLSLGGHAVLLAVIGLGLPQRPGTFSIDQRHPGILSASVSLQSPETVSPDAGNSIDLPLLKSVEPVEEIQRESSRENSIIDKADSKAAESSQPPESTGGPFTGSTSGPAETGLKDSSPVLLSILDPVYPMMARRADLEGVVIIEVTVDCEGNPVEYRIQPPHCNKLLEESAVKAVMNSRFKPGTYRGTPVQDIFRIRVRFELDQS